MTTHHPTLPPSSLDKKKHCPLWVSGEVGEAAIEGQESHAAAKEVKRRLEPVIIRGEPSVTLKRIEETKI